MTARPTISLTELAEKGADADLLKEMIQFIAQRMMEMDTESLCTAAYGERSADRGSIAETATVNDSGDPGRLD